MRCAALARTTGKRCKLEAGQGGFCDVVQHAPGCELAPGAREELEEAGLLDTSGAPGGASPPDPAPESSAAALPTAPEPRRAEISDPDDREDVPLDDLGADPLAGLEEAPGPEAEPAAKGGDAVRDPSSLDRVPEDLFAEPDPELEDGPGAAAPSPNGQHAPGQPLERWTAEKCEPLVRAPLDRMFDAHGKEALHDVEAELGGQLLADILELYASRLDPANPLHTVGLFVVIVFGPRYAPDVAAKLRARIRKRRGAIVVDEPDDPEARPRARSRRVQDATGAAVVGDDYDPWDHV